MPRPSLPFFQIKTCPSLSLPHPFSLPARLLLSCTATAGHRAGLPSALTSQPLGCLLQAFEELDEALRQEFRVYLDRRGIDPELGEYCCVHGLVYCCMCCCACCCMHCCVHCLFFCRRTALPLVLLHV